MSRHLNRQAVLPADLASRIDAAVKTLGYRPNAMARRLSRGLSEMLGVVTSDVRHPFFAAIASAAECEASRHGYGVMILNTRNQVSRELDMLARLDDGQVDGLVFLTNHLDDGALRQKIDACRNVVLIDEDVAGTRVPKFFVDNRSGGWLATMHLIEAGHRRIAYVGGPRGMISVDGRLEGYRNALAAVGEPIRPDLERFGFYDQETGHEALLALQELPEPPTAIFAASDVQVLGLYRAARELELAIPRDLSVIGFDDSPFAEFLNPALTTVRPPADDLGRLAVQALLAPVPPEPRIVTLPVELIERGSVAPLASAFRPTKKVRRRAPTNRSDKVLHD